MLSAFIEAALAGSVLELVILAVAVTTAYLLGCLIWPFQACPKCEGAGRFRSPSGKAWRRCGKCKGKGNRVRWGRRMWGKFE